MSPRRLLPALVAFVALPLAAQQPDARPAVPLALQDRLPVDPKVKIGTLPNGLRYYIRQNSRPEKRAELRLVVNAGSILEKNSQLGYAHFVEHTAFNGTRHFAKNELVKYLQSIGVRFGADLNAYTSFDETVYILPIPTDTQRIVDQAFTILEDWAHGQIFDAAEVVAERGVVREEWRGSKGAGERMLKQFLPIALKNSLYADRLPIGTEASIMGATPASLRSFYRDWYRADLMAVVAVGDFDPAMIEAKIKSHFSKLTKSASAPRRPVAPIPDNKAPLIAIASDKEAVSTNVSLFFKQPALPTRTVADYRRDIIANLYIGMLNSRFGEISQKPNAPFLGAGAGKGGFVGREIDPFSLGAAVKDGGVEAGLEALLVEARRVDQFGFLQAELDRAKTNMLRSYERMNAERDKTESVAYAEEYIRNYLEGEPIPGIEVEYAIVQKALPTIALNDVNHMAAQWITDDNRVVIVTAPQKDSVPLPTEAGILAVFDKAAKAPVVAYTEDVSADALIESPRPAGRIVSGRVIPGADVAEWKLSNGARVLVKATDFKADQVLFSAYSPGGAGFASDADYMSAAVAAQVIGLSGLGKFNLIDLQKKLAGKAARVSASYSETTEGLGGSASPKDLETLFELIYLHFLGARLDTTAFQAFMSNAAPFIANRGASPEQVFQDTIQVTMGQYSHRSRPLTTATFREINGETAVAFHRERFADAGDFTFVFVGSVDTTALKPLVEKYIASLPTAGRKDVPKVVSLSAPKGVIEKTVRRGVEPKARTLIYFTGSCVFTPENRVVMRTLIEVFQLRLIESLREKLGGTYSPGVGGGCNRDPRQEYSIRVSFESAPDNVEPLKNAVFALVDSLQQHGPFASDVERAKEQMLRTREVDLKQNSYWLSSIVARDQAGEDLAGILAPYDDLVKQVTPVQVQAAARQYLNRTNFIRFLLLPQQQ